MQNYSDKEVGVFVKKLKELVVDFDDKTRNNHHKFSMTFEDRTGGLQNITLIMGKTPSSRHWKQKQVSQLRRLMVEKNISTQKIQNLK